MFNTIVNQVLSNFDFTYILIVNILTYIIIKVIDYFNGNKKVSIVIKRLCLLWSIIVIGIIYSLIGQDTNITIINSAIATPVFWSWVLKPICIKFNIDYKHIEETIEK